MQFVAIIVREEVPLVIEHARPAGSKFAIVLEAAHDVLAFDLRHRISDVLRPSAANLRAEVGRSGDGSDGAVDDARMLRERGDGEKNERGGESELSHARLDRAAARELAVAKKSKRSDRSHR